METTSRPLFIILSNWILYGQLIDPYKEFFIEIRDDINDNEIWTERYNLITTNIPMFLSKDVVIKIFEIGKCINFIQKYFDEPNFSLRKLKKKFEEEIFNAENIKNNINKMEIEIDIDNDTEKYKENQAKLNYNFINNNNNNENILRYKKALNLLKKFEDVNNLNFLILPEIYSEIDAIHKEINKELMKILFEKFKFLIHLQSINAYLLLGQGDLWTYLMELLYDELKKPANQIYKHNILGFLDSAIKASNAQYHDIDCLKKLNVKLLDSSMGDTGWDIFVMDYFIDSPLTCIFTKDLMQKYQTLFFFFWKIKRLEYTQNHQVWRNFMTYSHEFKQSWDSLRPFIHKSMLFNQKIMHFTSNLHSYFTLEVLENQYKKLITKIKKIEYLDDLIELHKNFVEEVTNRSLLNYENSIIYKKIIEIFDLIFRFKSSQVINYIFFYIFNIFFLQLNFFLFDFI